MILRRIGSKKRIAHLIYPLFPKHNIYIEPFFGAGGMFFRKPAAKYNILNDLDEDVYTLWRVVQEKPQALYEEISQLIVHDSLLLYWRKNRETDPVKKAARFLFLSNFTFLGAGETLKLDQTSINAKKYILEGINVTNVLLHNCAFSNKDAICFVRGLTRSKLNKAFIYCDPPYVNTNNNYDAPCWDTEKLEDLILALHNAGAPFAISEYNNPIVIDLAARYNLQVTHIKNRRNLTSDRRSDEILLTNYAVPKQISIFHA